jgi:hypothetical protein
MTPPGRGLVVGKGICLVQKEWYLMNRLVIRNILSILVLVLTLFLSVSHWLATQAAAADAVFLPLNGEHSPEAVSVTNPPALFDPVSRDDLPAQRTATSATYVLPDGRYATVMAAHPIHYCVQRQHE